MHEILILMLTTACCFVPEMIDISVLFSMIPT